MQQSARYLGTRYRTLIDNDDIVEWNLFRFAAVIYKTVIKIPDVCKLALISWSRESGLLTC